MGKQEKRSYVAPHLTVVAFKAEQGYVMSSLAGVFWLSDAYRNDGGDAWSGSGSFGSSSFGGGWTDNGGSAWD